MSRLALSLASFMTVAILSVSAFADGGSAAVAPGDVASSGGPGPAPPGCAVQIPSTTWKVPVNAPGIPFSVEERMGAKFTESVSVEPTAEFSIKSDPTSSRPNYDRLFTVAGAKVGDTYHVNIGGSCDGGQLDAPGLIAFDVEFVAEAALPVSLGSLTEPTNGFGKLTVDPTFLPYQALATVTFTWRGERIAMTAAGHAPKPEDRYGIVVCGLGGVCADAGPPIPFEVVKPEIVIYSNLCYEGAVLMEGPLTAEAHIAGAQVQPAKVTGVLHVDCTKATREEIAAAQKLRGVSATNTPQAGNTSTTSSGCSLASLPAGATEPWSFLAVACVCAVLRRRAKATQCVPR